jgi:hypothetical protein
VAPARVGPVAHLQSPLANAPVTGSASTAAYGTSTFAPVSTAGAAPTAAAAHASADAVHPQQLPALPPTPPSSGVGVGAVGGSGGLSSSLFFAVLTALVAFWAAQALRLHRLSVALWRPMAFVSLLERPG